MVKGKTKSGFAYEVDSALLKDAEFMELFSKLYTGESMFLFKMITRLLGDKQKEKLYEHCRDEEGHVPLDALTQELLDIFEALGKADETKKS